MSDDLRNEPGVQSAAYGWVTPLSGFAPEAVAQYASQSHIDHSLAFNEVSDGYFSTMGTRLLAGTRTTPICATPLRQPSISLVRRKHHRRRYVLGRARIASPGRIRRHSYSSMARNQCGPNGCVARGIATWNASHTRRPSSVRATLVRMNDGDQIGACGLRCGDGAGDEGDDGHQDPGEGEGQGIVWLDADQHAGE
jgi:hypothetical protein